ncbi:uncharacterized protein SCHCODRAFT_02591720 [Schizophyllum commune H4-8]|uniref:Uncharacterized protein n=1 Tax=Schizophyllum commune (strain H4-8 / FGSC 9210) TaxID=578458 RepID=D8QJ69_SCHCM|nr:uncharacterized protein SCHCODRAFT_02591720 [Schizophyllum commune H4-8]KAI5886460.1 hypothetical protein SCHCODRAFT_02591720 [Schizophyllum commune H4-8]
MKSLTISYSRKSLTEEEYEDGEDEEEELSVAAAFGGESLEPVEDEVEDESQYWSGAQPRDDDDYWIDNDYGDAEIQTLRSTPSHSSVASTASATSNSTVSEVDSVASRSSSITLGRVKSWGTDNSDYRQQEQRGMMNDYYYLNRHSSAFSEASIGNGSYHSPSPAPSPPPLAHTPGYPVGYPYHSGYSQPAGLGRTDSVTTIATEPDDSVPDRRSPTPQPSSSAAPAQSTRFTNARRAVGPSPDPTRSIRGVEAHPSRGGLTMTNSWFMSRQEYKAAQAQMKAKEEYERHLQMARVDLEEVSRPRTRKPPRRLQAGGHGSLVLPEPQYRE